MRTPISGLIHLAAGPAVAGACAGGDAGEQAGDVLQEVQVPPPDTTAAALWAHLEGSVYQQTWALYPGKSRLYQGTEPHGMLLTTYVNTLARSALDDPNRTSLPAGTIIVKENYMPDSSLAAVTVMYKAMGFDPANNNWFWLKRNADGSIDAAGRGRGCIDCHGGRRDNDFIFTSTLSANR